MGEPDAIAVVMLYADVARAFDEMLDEFERKLRPLDFLIFAVVTVPIWNVLHVSAFSAWHIAEIRKRIFAAAALAGGTDERDEREKEKHEKEKHEKTH